MNSVDLNTIKRVHVIGIGGIGVSAIARMLHLRGVRVTGNDLKIDDEPHKVLLSLGIPISVGKTVDLVPEDLELVVYSVAWNDLAPEFLAEIRARGVPMFSYPEMLGVVSQGMKTVAVAGTHGKTTTTAMISKILRDGELDPTVIVGSLLKDNKNSDANGTNFIAGSSDIFLVEADEYRRAFLNLSPKVLVITNIDLDHLDYYKDLADIQSAFRAVAEKIPAGGALVCNPNDPNLGPVVKGLDCRVVDYTKIPRENFKLKVPGEHNIADAQAAWVVGEFLGVSPGKIASSLGDFSGAWRRFDFLGTTKTGALVYDDYAHNPQKVRAAIAGAREFFPDKKIVVVFQSHLYSRTKTLLKEFSQSFTDADEIVLAPIYASREAFDPSITSEVLADEIRKNKGSDLVSSFKDFNEIEKHLGMTLKKNEILMVIGAGDIRKVGENLVVKAP
jgi:UDP-N-acetylmuramate--alanine ligase